MNILILGDSFCHYDNAGTWPDELRRLGHTVTCVGEGGCSNYLILEKFRKHYNETYDYVIVLLTNENRLPTVNGPNYLCNHIPTSVRWGTRNTLPHGFEAAVESWVKHFYNHDFLRWTVTCGMAEIESAMKPHQTVVWVDAILSDNTIIDSANTGIKITGALKTPSWWEIERCKMSWKEFCAGSKTGNDLRKNHYIPSNQVVLAKFFDNVITKHRDRTLGDDDKNLLAAPWATDRDKIFPYLYPEHDYAYKEII